MWRRLLIVSLTGSSLAMTASAVLMLVGNEQLAEYMRTSDYLPMFFPIGWTAAGCVLAALRPRNPLGWLLLVGAAMLASSDLLSALAWVDWLVSPVEDWRDQLSSALRGMAIMFVPTVVLALYPDGRLPAPWWRWPVGVAFVGTSAFVGLDLLIDDRESGRWAFADDAIGLFVLAPAAVVIVAASLVRWRRASSPYRQQLAWFLGCGLAPFVLGYPLVVWVPEPLDGLVDPMLFMPIGVAVGVLCYRLLGIRKVLRRGLAYATLTVLVFLAYLGVTAILGKVLEAGGLRTVVAAAVVAVGLAPARDRLQRAADRIVYGARRDPLEVLTDLGRSVSGDSARAGLLDAAVAATAAAVRAEGALVVGPHGEVLARAGEEPTRAACFPVLFGGAELGELRVAEPPGGDRHSRAELRLLTALAAQLAVVLRATELAEDLEAERNRVVTATRDERDRLRRDLHDGLGPSLAGMGLGLQALAGLVPTGAPADAIVRRLRDETDDAVRDIRRIIDDLRPTVLDTAGLAQAVQRHAGNLRAALPIEVSAERLPVLGPDVEVAAYRIITEALTNAARHAHARHARVDITADELLRIEVTDDGHGIREPAEPAGVGLASMRRRAHALGGELAVTSTVGGTTVTATLPLRSR